MPDQGAPVARNRAARAQEQLEETTMTNGSGFTAGIRKLALTADGIEFRRKGLIWWFGLGRLGRLRVVIFG